MLEVVEDGIEMGGKSILREAECMDEVYECGIQPDGSKEWNRRSTLTTKKFAEDTRDMLRRWGMVFTDGEERYGFSCHGAIGIYSDKWDAPVTLANDFEKFGLKVTGSPKTSRAVGWQLMKRLLNGADRGEPGLFISERCESLWRTLPYCIADEKNPEDMTKDAPDHSSDAVRYVMVAANQRQHGWRNPPPMAADKFWADLTR